MIVAFDIDGTLIDYNDEPRKKIISLLKIFKSFGHKIIVWSGGGKDYASLLISRLKLDKFVDEYHSKVSHPYGKNVDICFDDEEVSLAKLNIKV
jgi:hydroxymethylpyrimidine pyrophosphatase-like HAD family hydrolase